MPLFLFYSFVFFYDWDNISQWKSLSSTAYARSYLLLLRSARVLQTCTEFFPVINFYFTEKTKLEIINVSSMHNEFKLLCVSGTPGLKVTNTPRPAKILGWILAGPAFSNGKPFVCRLSYHYLVFVGLVAISQKTFFKYANYIAVPLLA